jgi:hypothetical protein
MPVLGPAYTPAEGGSLNECGAGITEPVERIAKLDGTCSFPNPFTNLQDGEILLVSAVHASGSSDTLACNPTCAGAGWNFNSPSNPTLIQICQATCDAIMLEPSIQIDSFGICPIKK